MEAKQLTNLEGSSRRYKRLFSMLQSLDDFTTESSPGFQLFGGGLGLHEVTIDFVEHVQSFSCLVQCGFCHEL